MNLVVKVLLKCGNRFPLSFRWHAFPNFCTQISRVHLCVWCTPQKIAWPLLQHSHEINSKIKRQGIDSVTMYTAHTKLTQFLQGPHGEPCDKNPLTKARRKRANVFTACLAQHGTRSASIGVDWKTKIFPWMCSGSRIPRHESLKTFTKILKDCRIKSFILRWSPGLLQRDTFDLNSTQCTARGC